MEPLDEESRPTKRLCQPVDITPTNINFDHDAWDIADAFPDVIKDIETSLKEAKPDSAAALLGLDINLDDDDHHFNGLGSGRSYYQDSEQVEGANDLSMMEEMEGVSREETETLEGGVVEAETAEGGEVEVEGAGATGGEPRRIEDDKAYPKDEEQNVEQMVAKNNEEEEDINEEIDIGSDSEMVVIDEANGRDSDTDEKMDLHHATREEGNILSESVQMNNPSDLMNPQPNSGDASDGIVEEEGDDFEEEGDDEEEEEEEMEEWDSDSEGDLDALLDEGLPDQYKQSKEEKAQQAKGRRKAGEAWRKVLTQGGSLPEGLIAVKEKTVLKRHGQEPLEGLPDGWIRIAHQCGMPLYLHRPTRVCSWSRPYLLGSGSARRHRVPVAAIPCMHYSRALEKEKKARLEADNKEETANLPNGNLTNESPPDASIGADNPSKPDVEMKDQESGEKGEGMKKEKKSKVHICEDDSVDGKDLQEYLSRLFQFEKIAIKRFNSWAARRKYTKAAKHKDRPQFPGGPKVIRCEIPGNKGREFVINAQDKTPVCILHEYAQRVMRTQPQYIFGESRNASAPFEAVVEIQGTKYGRGEATSKRLAKADAAQKTLDILIPELISDLKPKTPSDTEYFDHVAIDDIRIYDLCMKAGQLTPWQVLQEHIQRSHGMADTNFSMNIKLKNHQRSEYTLTLGPHTVTGMCKNKANGKQQGAQKLLKQLYPELGSWGAIIKMYGKGSSEFNREKREAEQSVTELTQNPPRTRPNHKILNKLRLEMTKIYGEKTHLEAEIERQKKHGDDLELDIEEEMKMDPC